MQTPLFECPTLELASAAQPIIMLVCGGLQPGSDFAGGRLPGMTARTGEQFIGSGIATVPRSTIRRIVRRRQGNHL